MEQLRVERAATKAAKREAKRATREARGRSSKKSSAAVALLETAVAAATYDVLRGDFDKEKLLQFFRCRPGQVATRLATVIRVGTKLLRLWRRETNSRPSSAPARRRLGRRSPDSARFS